jgi:Fe-S cluster assembly protein SufB
MRSRDAVLTDKPLTELSRDDIIEFSKKREEPEWVLRRRLEAYEYLRSTPPDPRIDPLMERVTYKTFIESLENPVLPTEEAIRAAERLGVKPEELEVLASGFSIDVDNRLVKAVLKFFEKKGVIFTSMDEAVKKYPVVKDYAFRALHPRLNRKTAYHVMLWAGGPFIYVPAGVRIPQPLQGVFIIGREGLGQTEHTLIVLEEGAELHWIEGCTTPIALRYAVHLGGLEAFVKDNARLYVASINNWLGEVHHMPVKRAIVEGKNAYAELTSIAFYSTTSNTSPRVDVEGENSKAVIQNIALYRDKQKIYSAPLIRLNAPKTSAQILNRTVVRDEAQEEFRGEIYAARGAKDATGFMSCNTLIIGERAKSITVPAIGSEEKDAELSHEASVGRISYEKLYYMALMGFSEEEATWLIVNGFFEPVINKLPIDVQIEVKKILELALLGH